MIRSFFVWVHRWVGLLMASFLVITALTGSLLAFNGELERVFAPQLFATPRPGVAPLDLATLAERAQALAPDARVSYVLRAEPDQTLVTFVRRKIVRGGQISYFGVPQLFLDPWTGEELGRRSRGDLSEGWINVMPFVYKLHYTLTFDGPGSTILGIVAIAWSIDCFVGFYLTFPVSLPHFVRRWKSAWVIKHRAGIYRLNFDLHRAGGLWLWPLLFVFAWSSVMFNIRPVYESVMKAIFDYQSRAEEFSKTLTPANDAPRLDWRAALATGERLATELAAQRRFVVGEPLGLGYNPAIGAYTYEIRSSRDVFERSPKGGGTEIIFDGDSGALIGLKLRTGERAGNTVESWLYALHMARVFGMPFRILVCLLGLVITTLSATGVYIWWKKRKARRYRARVRGGAEAAVPAE
jgi:uncharacterized iron-regulated membrane protein